MSYMYYRAVVMSDDNFVVKITIASMGVYYHPRHAISRELSPQLGLIRQITPKYKKIEKIKNHR